MEKQNKTTIQGRRLVSVKSNVGVNQIRRLMLYTPAKRIPIAECEWGEDGQLRLIFKKKSRGQEAVYEKFTLPEFMEILMEEWPK